jgi:hypothetical protein
VWARCTQTHSGIGGFVEWGNKVRLAHPNVAQHPDRFELSGPIPDWIIERIRGNETVSRTWLLDATARARLSRL